MDVNNYEVLADGVGLNLYPINQKYTYYGMWIYD